MRTHGCRLCRLWEFFFLSALNLPLCKPLVRAKMCSLNFPVDEMAIKSTSSLSRRILPFPPLFTPLPPWLSPLITSPPARALLSPSSPHSARDGGPRGVNGKDVCAQPRYPDLCVTVQGSPPQNDIFDALIKYSMYLAISNPNIKAKKVFSILSFPPSLRS